LHLLTKTSSNYIPDVQAKSFVMNQNGSFSYNLSTLDGNVFDYVTKSSSFKSATQDLLGFSLNLMH
jgi:hypothetical protein